MYRAQSLIVGFWGSVVSNMSLFWVSVGTSSTNSRLPIPSEAPIFSTVIPSDTSIPFDPSAGFWQADVNIFALTFESVIASCTPYVNENLSLSESKLVVGLSSFHIAKGFTCPFVDEKIKDKTTMANISFIIQFIA